jgi:hypothetical protein
LQVHPAPQSQDQGIEILARGPVHEAYAEPVSAVPSASPVIPRQPPELLVEVPADQKPEGDVQWIPGYWSWDEERNDFLWVSGFWRLPPPGRDWVPGHWTAVEGGWQWTAGFWAENEQQELAYYPPPPDSVDTGPSVPAPTDTSVYVPGNWVYQETRYAWRPGFWSDYRPGWVWVPAHYAWTPAGYLYVEGYWDYPLRERGLLFAPVAIDLSVALAPDWSYRPSYVVTDDCLLGALFVNPGCDHYYFGDYFDAGYRRHGFIGWLDFHFGHGGCDPLYGYYRSYYGAESHWEHGLRDLYAGRYSGELDRPPLTLVQQNTVVQNITNNLGDRSTTINNITNVNNVTKIQNVTMLTALTKVGPAIAKLQPVGEQAQLAAVRSAQDRLVLGEQRGKLESQLAAQGHLQGPASTGSVTTTGTPQVRKISLPRTPIKKASAAAVAPAPLTANHSIAKSPLPSTSISARPEATAVVKRPTQPLTTTPTAPSQSVRANKPATSASTPMPMKKNPTAALTKGTNRNSVTQTPASNLPVKPQAAATRATAPSAAHPAVTKSAAKSQTAPAQKQVTHQSVSHTPAPIAKPQAAAPRAAPKLPAANNHGVQHPAAPVVAPKAVAKPQVAAQKAAARPQTASKPVAQRAVAPPAAPRVVAKPQAPAPKPAARPQVVAKPPAPRPAAKPQPAATPK